MSLSTRAASVWAQTVPVARRTALLLTGDPGSADRVARAVYVRVRGTWKDVGARDSLEASALRATVDLLRPRPWRRYPVPPGLEKLRFRRRVATLLVMGAGLRVDEVADALRCSPAAIAALHARTMAERGEVVTSYLSSLPEVAGEQEPGEPAAQRRATEWRAAVALAVVVALSAAGAFGFSLARSAAEVDDEPPVPEPSTFPVDDTLRPAALPVPRWCPDLQSAQPLSTSDGPEANTVAIRFNVGIALGYPSTVRRLSIRPRPAPRPLDWPGPRAAGGARVVDSRPLSGEVKLVDRCGPTAAELTWLVAMRSGERDAPPVAYYLISTSDGFRVWGSAVGAVGS